MPQVRLGFSMPHLRLGFSMPHLRLGFSMPHLRLEFSTPHLRLGSRMPHLSLGFGSTVGSCLMVGVGTPRNQHTPIQSFCGAELKFKEASL
jgi:hypothetical protein